MADIQSATAEIILGEEKKKERRKNMAKNIMVCNHK